MFLDPHIVLELARQQHQARLAEAERRRLANACGRRSGHSAGPAHERHKRVRQSSTAPGTYDEVLTRADHFGHRETGGIVVDLYWQRRGLEDEFLVAVEDKCDGGRFVLHPPSGRAALQAFYHPFSMVER